MKRKVFLIFIAFCSLSSLSSAGKYEGKCCKYSSCTSNKSNVKQVSPGNVDMDLNISPLSFIVSYI